MMDRPSSLDERSIPFVFDHMNLEGRVPLDLTALDAHMDKKIAMPMDKKDAKPLTRALRSRAMLWGFSEVSV